MKRFVSLLKACVIVCLLAGCLSAETKTALKNQQEMSDVNTPMRTWNEAKSVGRTILEGTWLYKDENSSTMWIFVGNSYHQIGELFDTPANRDEFSKQGLSFTPMKVFTYGTIDVTDLSLKMTPLVIEQNNTRTALPEAARPLIEYDYSINGNEMALFQNGQSAFSLLKQ
jgi:hypothetical protein